VRRWVPLLAAAFLAGCGSGAGSSGSGISGHGLQGLILNPSKPAPALALSNYTGERVTLAQFRGKAVLVTFVYTHCPDVCQLIVANLAQAQRRLGPEARHAQILAVTVDPKRDTPVAIRSFLTARDATGRMDYLIGRYPQLLATWKAWQVGVNLNRHQVTVGHSSVIYGITASGRMAVVYNSDVSPAAIAHDVPLLARR